MDEERKLLWQRRFWPTLIIGAFVLGAILWSVWMYRIVVKTKENRENKFFVPPPVEPKGTNQAGR